MIILEKKTTNTQSKQKEEIINNRNKSIQLRTEKQQEKLMKPKTCSLKNIQACRKSSTQTDHCKKMKMKITNMGNNGELA